MQAVPGTVSESGNQDRSELGLDTVVGNSRSAERAGPGIFVAVPGIVGADSQVHCNSVIGRGLEGRAVLELGSCILGSIGMMGRILSRLSL